MLPEGIRQHVVQAIRRAWVLYGVVLLGVVVELGMGLYVYSALGQRGVTWDAKTVLWTSSLVLLTAAQGVGGLLVHRWLVRPAVLRRQLQETLTAEGITGPIPLELLTVVGVRAVFLADVVAWILLQFITVYGLILVVVTGRLWLLLTFAVLSVVLLTRVAPSAARVVRLVEDLDRLD